MIEFYKKHSLLAGTLTLTAAGLLSRILGFFYRIFLSRTIGAEGIGIYQMIFPVYGICFSLCAGSLQTAISRFTAADRDQAKRILFTGFLISFSLSLVFMACIMGLSRPIAVHILMEPRCASLLSVMALAFPCVSIHACISGYYYGKEQVHVPAAAQFTEQFVRILTVYLVTAVLTEQGKPVTVRIAVLGLVAGEAASALFTLLSFLIFSDGSEAASDGKSPHRPIAAIAAPLMTLALPLMANRLIMNLLQSAEAVLIPSRLGLSGLTHSQALSIYGVLTGMAMPFIMFPSAIVNSLAVVLLPNVARQQSSGNHSAISENISMSFRYSLYMGILCIGIFTVFGEDLGLQVFKNRDAGVFISILAWLCPFLYLATTMGSILNGLGKTSVTFFHNLISLIVRLMFVFWGIPVFGIRACLWGMLAGELLLALLHLNSLSRLIPFSRNVWGIIVKPAFCLAASLGIFRLFPETLPLPAGSPPILMTFVKIFLVCTCYLLLLLLFHRRPSPTEKKGRGMP